ncbi:MAG: hypothetical protein EOO14_07245 [Chitinophagaceae bacterium]|nr:MAG: hypothetical protein EOO14_07245 [Chitinophagaceae bacterium]
MKKILTLLFAVGAITLTQAQSSRSYPNDRNTTRDVILGDRNEGNKGNDRNNRNDRYDNRYENNNRYAYSFSARERDKQVDRINKEYDKKIRQVERDRRLRSSEKSYKLRQLEGERREEIRQVWDRFQSRNNAHNDNRYATNNRRW